MRSIELICHYLFIYSFISRGGCTAMGINNMAQLFPFFASYSHPAVCDVSNNYHFKINTKFNMFYGCCCCIVTIEYSWRNPFIANAICPLFTPYLFHSNKFHVQHERFCT